MDIEFFMPDIGMKEVEIIEILVSINQKIIKEDGIISVENQKSVLEIPSPYSGIIKKIFVKIGDKVSFNTLLCIISIEEKDNNSCVEKTIYKYNNIDNNVSNDKSIQDNINCINEQNKLLNVSPNVRRIARLFEINLNVIKGTGKNGKILLEDLSKYKNTLNIKKSNFFQKENDFSIKENITKNSEKHILTRIQRISGEQLSKSWTIIPHVTQFDEADITELEDFRKSSSLKNFLYNKDIKITILPFIIKSVSLALKKFKKINSQLSLDKKELIINKDINIGVAVETPNGLIVPILSKVDKKSISDIAYDLSKIIHQSKNNQLNTLKMKYGSFTISSLGGIGGTNFTPIVNSPEACILGVSKAKITAIWKENGFSPRLILPFSLSYDHRIIDGAEAVRFTTYLSKLLSDIRFLLI